ncbi:hypothetical protein Hanom_Chr17g01581831 [Helianthus anomalus]
MFADEAEDIVKRKVEKMVKQGKSPKIDRCETVFDRQNWFRTIPSERKFRSPLSFFMRNKDISLGDIISWSWIPKLKVIAIRRNMEFSISETSIISKVYLGGM